MKLNRINIYAAIFLSCFFVIVTIWNIRTGVLGSKFDPDAERISVVGQLLIGLLLSLLFYVLLIGLKKRKLFFDLLWIVLAPALLLIAWDTIAVNLVERGILSSAWLTDSAYPEAQTHRTIWLFSGIIISLPFLYNVYSRFSNKIKK